MASDTNSTLLSVTATIPLDGHVPAGPPLHRWVGASNFARCADQVGGLDDLFMLDHECPICGAELNEIARRTHGAMDHLYACFFAGSPVSFGGWQAELGQAAYDTEQAVLADVPADRHVRETGATYSIHPTTRQRQRITVGGRHFAVGDHVAVLARSVAGQDAEGRHVVCTGYVTGIAERRDDYNITPREVTLDLAGVLSPRGDQIDGLRTATVAAELVAQIGTRELPL